MNAIPTYLRFRQFYRYVDQQIQNTSAKPLEAFEASFAGKPKDVINIHGKEYPVSVLDYYLDYLYTCSFIDYSQVKLFIELGSGSGNRIEVIKKMYPDIYFLLFDIHKQLYVCEQYLSTVFPDDAVSYRSTR